LSKTIELPILEMWYTSVHKPIIMGVFLRLSALQGLAHYQYQETLVELKFHIF